MLAASMDPEKGQSTSTLTYPVWVTPKLDGIRCLQVDGVSTSRSLKPIPNLHIRQRLQDPKFNGMDGELVTYTDGKRDEFNTVQSKVMSEDGRPDFSYEVFDRWDMPHMPYQDRVRALLIGTAQDALRVNILAPIGCANEDELIAFNVKALAEGFEGSMVRDIRGRYKYGRATFNEGLLTKVKPFEDAEAEIVGFEELMRNDNEATKDALGHTERSSHKANKTPMNTLGALICKNEKLWPGVTFKLGTGYSAEMRKWIWEHKDEVLKKITTFKYQAIGMKDRPRILVWKGFRDKRDM